MTPEDEIRIDENEACAQVVERWIARYEALQTRYSRALLKEINWLDELKEIAATIRARQPRGRKPNEQ